MSAGLSLSCARLSPSATTSHQNRLRVLGVGAVDQEGPGWAGLAWLRLSPHQLLLEVLVIPLPSQLVSIRVRLVVNKPQHAIGQDRAGEGRRLQGQPLVPCQTRVSSWACRAGLPGAPA